jgi:rubredoxin
MATTELIYINFTGGIVSPGYLKDVLEIAAANKVTHASLGLLQQLMMDVPAKHFASFSKACEEKNITFYKKKAALPNIVSSYPAAGIFTTESWLREGVYKDVFNLFDYVPKLKINICDSTQSFIPFFTGHLNWISSDSPHFWYLYIRLPKSQTVICWPELVYTNDLPLLSRHLEQYLLNGGKSNVTTLYKKVKPTISYIAKAIDKEMELPKFSLPYYEGFNKHENSWWLGIYRRDELFQVQFLLDLCSICLQLKIGELYTTPWKSIIIKGIQTTQRNLWDYTLGHYRINVRHAANELNWQVEDYDEEGLMLKRHIIRYFDKEDVRTFGLSFAVQTNSTSNLFGSVIIRKQQLKNSNRLKSLDRFDILHTSDFNPNSANLVIYRQDVEKEYLGVYLVSLCKFFYETQSIKKAVSLETVHLPVNNIDNTAITKLFFQCTHCFTIYDEAAGDVENNIAAGTSFSDLPESYHCPLCESGKNDFVAIDENSLELQGA